MKLGLWGCRADHGGLAAMSIEAYRHLGPAKTVVIDLPHHPRGPAAMDSYGDEVTVQVGMDHLITTATVDEFLDGIDVVLGFETFYVDWFADRARQAGVSTVLVVMPELLRADHAPPDLHVVPTTWEADRVPDAVHLPFPVARDRLPYRARTECRTLLHVAATPFWDRNGTRILRSSLRHMTAKATLLVRGGKQTWPARYNALTIRHLGADVAHYWDAWPVEADALVLPRRYAGQCLPMMEAASLGLPIVTLDVEPQRDWLPTEALVPARKMRSVRMVGGDFDVFDASPVLLAHKLDELIGDPAMCERLSKASDTWAESMSWQVLGPRWVALLEAVAAG